MEVKSGATLQVESGGTLQVESGGLFNFGEPLTLAAGGLGVSLSDPGADRVLFWDDSAGDVAWLTVGSGLAISTTTLAATPVVASATASLDYGSISAGAEATLTITVTGAATTGTPSVQLGWSAALEDGLIVKQAWVSGADTVSIRLLNISENPIDPDPVTCRATVATF